MISIYSIKVRLPIFSTRYIEAAEVFTSSLLPSPRTCLSIIARGLCEFNGMSSEEVINGLRVGDIASWAVELSSYAFVRPHDPLCKSSHIWRVIMLEAMWKNRVASLKDAVECEYITTGELAIYYVINFKELNKYVKDNLNSSIKVNDEDIIKFLSIIQRLGGTEFFSSIRENPRKQLIIERLGNNGSINVYIPLNWVKNFEKGIIESMHVNLLLLEDNKMHNIKNFKSSREEYRRFLLPLQRLERFGSKSLTHTWYEPVAVNVRLKDGYVFVKIEDGTAIPIQIGWLS
ncbi:MAG: hypothetical protein QXK35_06115 [Nitrososphaerales archaeon]